MTPYVLVSGDFVTTGGMDRGNYALASYLARSGRPVHLVSHRAAPDLLAQSAVSWHRVPKPFGSYFLGEPFLRRAGCRWGRAVARRGGRILVNGGNCSFEDVNWVHYVHAVHRPDARGLGWRAWKVRLGHALSRRAECKSLRRARLVITNSDVTRRDVIARFGLDPARVHTVYYGIDAGTFRPADPAERALLRRRQHWPVDRPLVMFIGALGDRRKGFDTLFSAWKVLCREPDWDATLVVVGSGARLQTWRDRSRDEGLQERIEFCGFRRDVPELLRAADVLVAPTLYEAYGLGVHEALCCGLPAFVSATAGIAERYPAECRELLIPDPRDAIGLADRLRRWRRDRPVWPDRVRPFARELAARTWDDMAADIVRLIEGGGPVGRRSHHSEGLR